MQSGAKGQGAEQRRSPGLCQGKQGACSEGLAAEGPGHRRLRDRSQPAAFGASRLLTSAWLTPAPRSPVGRLSFYKCKCFLLQLHTTPGRDEPPNLSGVTHLL